MAYSKDIICLAASWKHQGTCIAGKEYVAGKFGGWIRPISSRPGEEISQVERRKDNAFLADVLDVVTISFEQHKPHLHQKENHVISNITWKHKSILSADQARGAIDNNVTSLWANGYSSTKGQNYRVPEHMLNATVNSLFLIEPQNFTLHAVDEVYDGQSKRKYRSSFMLSGVNYNLSVTDPWISSVLKNEKAGDYSANKAIACISLGEVMGGYAYKLVASVITQGRRV